MFPAKQPSKVVVKTIDGKEYSEYLEYPKGDPREPMTAEDLITKFNALSSDLLSPERQQEIRDVVSHCEKFKAEEFMQKLVV